MTIELMFVGIKYDKAFRRTRISVSSSYRCLMAVCLSSFGNSHGPHMFFLQSSFTCIRTLLGQEADVLCFLSYIISVLIVGCSRVIITVNSFSR